LQAAAPGKETRAAGRNDLAMTEHEASRTLVKSPPELWAECSDAASLARHLGAFGEIRITKLEPETAVAWEGEDVRGTVTIEPSGWGTRVVLTATSESAVPSAPVAPAPPPEPGTPEPSEHTAEPVAESAEPIEEAPDPMAEILDPVPGPRTGWFARFMARLRGPEIGPAPVSELPPEIPDHEATMADHPKPRAPEPARGASPELDALIGALDSLGTAHRRPFSRG
jgi:hypothetical protein